MAEKGKDDHAREISPWERMQAKEERERQMWEEVRRIATNQGLALVKVSARRYLVVKINGGCVHMTSFTPGQRHTYMDAEVAFGPDTFEACRQWLFDNTDPVPPSVYTLE